MRKDRSSSVEKPICSELDPWLDDPAEGAEMVICDIGDQERVVGA
jgi:hypothetical protein